MNAYVNITTRRQNLDEIHAMITIKDFRKISDI